MSYSAAALEALARSENSTRHLMGVAFHHSTFTEFGGVIRIVNYDYDISNIDGDTYTGMAMETMIPETGAEPSNDVRLRIDGVAGSMNFFLNRAAQYDEPVLVDLKSLLYNVVNESVIEVIGRFYYEMKAAQFDLTSVMPQIGAISPTNQPFPGIKYNALSHPALYN